jgi:hypothetical protein
VTVDRRLVIGLSALATAAVVVVAVDLPGTLGGLVVLAFVLLGPGLAGTLLMGPMAGEARVLASLAGSVALGVVVSVAMALTDTWSTLLGVAALALFTQTCVIVALRRHADERSARAGAADAVAAPPPGGKETNHG